MGSVHGGPQKLHRSHPRGCSEWRPEVVVLDFPVGQLHGSRRFSSSSPSGAQVLGRSTERKPVRACDEGREGHMSPPLTSG